MQAHTTSGIASTCSVHRRINMHACMACMYGMHACREHVGVLCTAGDSPMSAPRPLSFLSSISGFNSLNRPIRPLAALLTDLSRNLRYSVRSCEVEVGSQVQGRARCVQGLQITHA